MQKNKKVLTIYAKGYMIASRVIQMHKHGGDKNGLSGTCRRNGY